MDGLWIALGVIFGLLVLFILYDKRKQIFKKHKKKEKPKTKKINTVQEKPEKEEKEEPKVSFEQRTIPEKPISSSEAVIEDVDLSDLDEQVEYQQTISRPSMRRPNFPPRPRPERERPVFRSHKKSIKQQIKELSPEMKAIVMANVLQRKDS